MRRGFRRIPYFHIPVLSYLSLSFFLTFFLVRQPTLSSFPGSFYFTAISNWGASPHSSASGYQAFFRWMHRGDIDDTAHDATQAVRRCSRLVGAPKASVGSTDTVARRLPRLFGRRPTVCGSFWRRFVKRKEKTGHVHRHRLLVGDSRRDAKVTCRWTLRWYHVSVSWISYCRLCCGSLMAWFYQYCERVQF